MTNETQAFTVAPALTRGLRRLAYALRLRLAVRGLGWVLAAACAAAWASFILDFGLTRLTMSNVGPGVRVAVNAVCLAGVLTIAWKRLVRALLRAYTDEDLATLVERAHPQLQNRLISAVQFSQAPESAAGASPELVRRVLVEAAEGASRVDFLSALDLKPVWRAALVAAALALATAALAVVGAGLAVPWAQRNLLLREASYPKRTVLRVAGGNPIRVLRGDPLTLNVTAEPGRFAPRDVTFHFRFPSVGATIERVAASPADPRSYAKNFPTVTESFSFRVSGNDDKTEEVRVELVEPPELKEMEIEIRSPVYTGIEPKKMRRGSGLVDVPEGGVIALKGVATKPLSEARMFLDDVPAPNLRIASANGNALRRIEGEIPIKATTPFRSSMTLRIELKDTDGFPNKRAASYSLIVRQDQPPVCQMETDGIGGEITTNALIPLAISAKDDYGVFAVHLEMSVLSDPRKVRQDPMYAYQPPVPEPEPLRKAVDLRLAGRHDSTNTPPLNVGETLRLQAVATDSRPDNPFKTRSNLLTFRIVTPEDLASRAVDAQRAVREQISQVVEMQKETRDRCLAAAKDAQQDTTLGVARREVSAAAEAQQQIRDLLANASGRLESILGNLRNNRAIGSDDELRLRTRIMNPIAKVANEAGPQIADRLAKAKTIVSGEDLAKELADVASDQEQRIIRVLEAVVGEMLKLETAEQVERGVRALIRQTEQVREVMKTGSGMKPVPQAPKTP